MQFVSLINGISENNIVIANRSFNFGDGIFETCKVENGKILLLNYHLQRLQQGVKVLNLNLNYELLLNEINNVLSISNNCVLKIIISRGNSNRGYGYTNDIQAIRILTTSKIPPIQQKIILNFCKSGYCHNSKLAGIKHQNRLEQILARKNTADCIMLDEYNNVISTTSANIFMIKDNIIYTPNLGKCGIKGTVRAFIIDNFSVIIKDINQQELLSADEVFISNSVFGVVSVRQITDKYFANIAVKLIQQKFAKI